MGLIIVSVGLLTIGDNKASAYTSHCVTPFYVYADDGGYKHTKCVSDDASNVTVKVRQTDSPSTTFNWKMELQRYTSGSWTTIGTRTGYVSSSSPSDRTFTNVLRNGSSMRVKTTFYGYSTKVVYSSTWTR